METITNVYGAKVEVLKLSEIVEDGWYITHQGYYKVPCRVVSTEIVPSDIRQRESIEIEFLDGSRTQRYVANVQGTYVCVDATLSPTLLPLTETYLEERISKSQRALAEAQANFAAAQEVQRIFSKGKTPKSALAVKLEEAEKKVTDYEDNIKFLLDITENAVRSKYKGGEEDLIGSLAINYLELLDAAGRKKTHE